MNALRHAQLRCFAIAVIAYAGCVLAVTYSSDPNRIIGLCLGFAVLSECALLLSYGRQLKQQRHESRQRGEQITAHSKQIF